MDLSNPQTVLLLKDLIRDVMSEQQQQANKQQQPQQRQQQQQQHQQDHISEEEESDNNNNNDNNGTQKEPLYESQSQIEINDANIEKLASSLNRALSQSQQTQQTSPKTKNSIGSQSDFLSNVSSFTFGSGAADLGRVQSSSSIRHGHAGTNRYIPFEFIFIFC